MIGTRAHELHPSLFDRLFSGADRDGAGRRVDAGLSDGLEHFEGQASQDAGTSGYAISSAMSASAADVGSQDPLASAAASQQSDHCTGPEGSLFSCKRDRYREWIKQSFSGPIVVGAVDG